MLSGCIPVGSDVGGMGQAIGAAGFLVPPDRLECLVDALRSALDAPEELGLQARERIRALFPVERRQKTLESLLDPERT
jgi:glycosyltransferase involved in cell wall biosynthesis